MYNITCCRQGKYLYRQNLLHKGCFNKTFNTLSEFVNFFIKSRRSLFFPNIDKELTKKEKIIVLKKIDAILNKQ